MRNKEVPNRLITVRRTNKWIQCYINGQKVSLVTLLRILDSDGLDIESSKTLIKWAYGNGECYSHQFLNTPHSYNCWRNSNKATKIQILKSFKDMGRVRL